MLKFGKVEVYGCSLICYLAKYSCLVLCEVSRKSPNIGMVRYGRVFRICLDCHLHKIWQCQSLVQLKIVAKWTCL
ncbi:Os10g0357850 [Oryza sativa Japonica Group]|uniref:Os10g0357850 protein n=1 Tax=Oryza sativa subsp. japonica TaxID=39947 RepID=A0A0P0XTR5_ORYSJ|nr:Os10g0357850 [Oryza sativa Japonica Group]